ncbi:hypothetical protein EGW08_009812 [Elysia chlorotica]|uniref:protein disulfide-isomerase n=1 Tax=Elysia chlorotica TaxID=188477 RepID=A0A3S1C420_ELYCH|nr:hypothetical protein EGW08_009812 [Elysia chlorotica]
MGPCVRTSWLWALTVFLCLVADGRPEIVTEITAYPTGAPVYYSVTLECLAYNVGTFSAASIANVTWTQGNQVVAVTQENSINVTSDTPGVVNYTCIVVDDAGQNATATTFIEFFSDALGDVDDIIVTLSAYPMEAAVSENVTLECNVFDLGNNTENNTSIVIWTQAGQFLKATSSNKINVTSDIPGEVNFTCTVIDVYGNNATANGTVEFFEDVLDEDFGDIIVALSAYPMEAAVSENVTLECNTFEVGNYTEIPISNVTWTQAGQFLDVTQTNKINVTSDIPGEVNFTCTVIDIYGRNATANGTVEFITNEDSSMSVYPEICGTGQGYSWVQARCADCDGQNEYNDGGQGACAYCRYSTGRADACDSSDPAKTTAIGRRDVCITSAIWSVTCDASSLTLAQIGKSLSKDFRVFFLYSFPDSSGLCANDACENVVVSVARKGQLCQALTCNASLDCVGYNYRSTVKACLYDVDEFVNTGVDSVYRRAEEVFLESLRNIGQFPSSGSLSTTFMEGLKLSSPPIRLEKTAISDMENRELYAQFHTSLSWSSAYESTQSTEYTDLNAIIQDQMPSMFGQSSGLLYVTLTDTHQYEEGQTSSVGFTVSFVFQRAIDNTLVQTVAEIGIRSHSISGGMFGNASFHFQSGLYVFRNQSDMQSDRSGVVWCTYLETLSQSLSLNYCDEDTECSNTDLWFECVQDDTHKQQRDLYPYGTSVGDSVIEWGSSNDWYWYYNYISETINFSSGAPFGIRKMKFAHVLPNGVIMFGSPKRAWWPNLYYAQYYKEQNILAPFWHYTKFYSNSGKTYYQLYEKPGANGGFGLSSPSVDTWSAVLDRAKSEVEETLAVEGFSPTTALVATWYQTEPYNWWDWLCKYYLHYGAYWWWSWYYQPYYERYCLSQQTEQNTFQCVYVTDGQTAYAITTYKAGEMNWIYDRYRPIEVGFSNPSETRDFGLRNTDLTTKLTTNTFNTGRYGTWIEKVGEFENTDAKCVQFFIENIYMIWNSTHQALLDNLYKCPCNIERLGFQWTFYSWEDASSRGSQTYKYCYYLGRKSRDSKIRNNPHNKLCCYYYTYPTEWTWEAFRAARRNSIYISYGDPNAGHILKHDPYRPWFWRSGSNARLSKQEDFDPKNWCTRDSSVPSFFGYLFQLVRPDMGCSNEVEWFLGRAMGDPHISTLDSKSYTFNGKGEYILLQVDSLDFSLQARTDQALSSQGNSTSATVFVAFAAKEGTSSKFQVELDDDRTGMIITANDNDISAAFYRESNYTFETDELTVERQERNSSTVVSAAFPSNIALEVYVGMKNLEFTVTVPTSLKGKTSGMMGNYNDDSSDDFILPDGTQLTNDQTNTERKIFENFGREWEVTSSSSIFKYANDESALTYQFPDFEPLFREEANQTLLQEAEQTCGAQEDACIFDLLATGDQTFAEATRNLAQEDANMKQSLSNNLPVLSLSTTLSSQNRWQVIHEQEETLQFSATDADGDTVTFELVDAVSGVNLDNSTGVLTYLPDHSSSVVIGVRASDGRGKSSPLYINIVVCTGCNNNGSCDWSQTRETEYENGRFLISGCSCWPAYTGDDCDEDVDGCADDPCGEGLNCTDIAAADQRNETIGYLCGDCPDGYDRQGSSCVDTNECIENGTNPVCPQNSDCENSIGSYTCSCSSGYRTDPADENSCKDVDECAELTHDCEQVCDNIPGSFNCSCYGGSTLNQDEKSCSSGISCNTACDHFCQQNDDGSKECNCRRGYELDTDGTTCNDLDECFGKTPCSQGCTNTVGGFTCYCFSGFQLAADNTSCTECETSYWGDNCAKQCQCNGHGTCDRARGCVCAPGWTGTRCVNDVDECAEDRVCPAGQLCTNTIGSYKCSCPSGYSMQSDVCIDIDECSSQSHGCQQLCENTDGSYNCDCYLGYRLDSDRQTCVLNIDECQYDHLNLCGYKLGCVNTVGGFQCTCPRGSQLDNDERSCVACGTGTWGNNCAHSCHCDWEGASTCDPENGCVCKSGFTGTYCENDVDECASGALTCEEGESCVNLRGSAECRCSQGYTRVLGTCTDLDECAIMSNNDCDQLCTNYAGGYQCSCHPGYKRSGDQCVDVDECTINSDECEQGCENSEGSYRCTCPEGLKLLVDGVSCVVEDACVTRTDCSHTCAIVNDTETCFCPRGRALDVDGATCIDIDLCAGAPCVSICNETLNGTSFECSCVPGQQLTNDGFNCSDCVEGSYGTECSQQCSCNTFGTASCDKVTGTCTCIAGWGGVDCATDLDECSDNSHNCSSKPYSTCENTPGSFVCKCDDGYFTENGQCSACQVFTFGDECAGLCDCSRDYSSGCDAVTGACICNSGWSGASCNTDIDECSVANNCTAANRTHWICANTPGSFSCQCDEGYQDSNDECIDVDECAADFTNLCNQNCTNTVGNYTCSCNSGYVLASDRRTCEDEDECSSGQHSCEDICSNVEPSYTCSCQSGRELDTDDKSCYTAFTTSSTVTLVDLDATGLNLREKLGDDFRNMVALVQPELLNHFREYASGVTKITINELRAGSVIVDFTTVINSETTDNAESSVADALVALATNGITINGTYTTAEVVIGSLVVTSSTDKCEIMAVLNACDDDQVCLISESGSAFCSSSSDDDLDIGLIVGLSVGLPLAAIAAGAIVVAIWYKKKYKGQKRVNSRMDNYNDSVSEERSRMSSPDPFTLFKTNQLKSSLIEVD